MFDEVFVLRLVQAETLTMHVEMCVDKDSLCMWRSDGNGFYGFWRLFVLLLVIVLICIAGEGFVQNKNYQRLIACECLSMCHVFGVGLVWSDPVMFLALIIFWVIVTTCVGARVAKHVPSMWRCVLIKILCACEDTCWHQLCVWAVCSWELGRPATHAGSEVLGRAPRGLACQAHKPFPLARPMARHRKCVCVCTSL